MEQARERRIDVPTEPFRIVEMIPLPGHIDGEHYWGIADFLLAEYTTELGFLIANAFHNLVPQVGYEPFGKIMIGTQFVDRKAGSPTMTRLSFMEEHPTFYQYISERDCPERTKNALAFLVAGVFQFPDANYSRQIFPKMFVVPEMESGVIQELYSIDKALARYIVG